jgi:hypothetical protein
MSDFNGPSPDAVMNQIQSQADSMPAPQEQQQSTPSTEAAPAPQTQVGAAPHEDGEEFEYSGQKVKLSKAEREYLMRMGLDAYSEAYRQLQAGDQQADASQQQAQQPQAQAPNPDLQRIIQQEVASATKELKAAAEKVNTWERQAEIRQVLTEAESAITNDPILKDIHASASPEDQRFLQAFTIYAHSLQPNANWQTVTSKVGALFKGYSERSKADFVKAKVEQSQRRIEGSGGAVPSGQTKPFSRADWNNGRMEAETLKALEAAMRES